MVDNSGSANARNSLRRILLNYLRIWTLRWPGGDGLTEDDVLSGLPQAIKDKAVPSIWELCRLHPELANELITHLGFDENSTND